MSYCSYKRYYSVIRLCLIFAGLFIVIGCQKDDQSPTKTIITKGPTLSSGGDHPTLIPALSETPQMQDGIKMQDGTSDSAGTSGFDKKAFASYIFDPLTSPKTAEAMKTIESLLPSLSKMHSDNYVLPIFSFDWKIFFGFKTWYIGPVQCKDISNNVLGVTWSKNKSETIACQTLGTPGEIWINETYFSQLSPEEQGDLLLNELIEVVYLLKFLPYENILKVLKFVLGPSFDKDLNKKDIEFAKKYIPSEGPRGLKDEDYYNIRAVHAYLKRNIVNSGSLSDFNKNILNHKFDPRFFRSSPWHPSHTVDSLTIDSDNTISLVREFIAQSNSSLQCLFLSSNTTQACKIEEVQRSAYQPASPSASQSASPSLSPSSETDNLVSSISLNFLDNDSNFKWTVAISLLKENKAKQVPFYSLPDEDVEFIILPTVSDFIYPKKIKDNFKLSFLVLRKNKNNSNTIDFSHVDAIVLMPYVVTAKTKEQPLQCDAISLASKDPWESSMIVFSERIDKTQELLLIQSFFTYDIPKLQVPCR